MKHSPFTKEASRLKSTFKKHGHIRLPKDLKQGDIIQAYIPAKNPVPGDKQYNKLRKCMILGLEVDSTTMEVKNLHVIRLSFLLKKGAYPSDLKLSKKDTGLNKPALLRTNRIDILPLNSPDIYFQPITEKRGKVNQKLFPEINERLNRGLSSDYAERSRTVAPAYPNKTILLPSLSREEANNPFNFTCLGKDFTPLSKEQLNKLSSNAAHTQQTARYTAQEGVTVAL